jgi:hypothetical protein
MEIAKNKYGWFAASVLAGVVLVFGFWWLNQGYGKVSPLTYQYSKALYSACLTKNEGQLAKVEELLAKSDSAELPANERQWINAILTEAREGEWDSAAQKARRMMEDQVQF